jgi:quinol monooxygenase YgiN
MGGIMENQHISVVAKFVAKEGSEKALEDFLLSTISPTRAEAGCVDYRLHRSVDAPGLFFIYETWQSQKDLQAHTTSPYIREAMPKVVALVREPPSVTVLRQIT